MFDSSGKSPSGLLKGNLIELGQFDECLEIQHPNGNFTGEYCILQLMVFDKANGSEASILDLFPTNEVRNSVEIISFSQIDFFGKLHFLFEYTISEVF